MRLLVTGRNTGGGGITVVAGDAQVLLDQPARHSMQRNEPDLAALALDPKMHHAVTALHVLDPKAAQLLAADAVIEQGGEDGATAHALERVRRGHLQQLARLSISESRLAAFPVARRTVASASSPGPAFVMDADAKPPNWHAAAASKSSPMLPAFPKQPGP